MGFAEIEPYNDFVDLTAFAADIDLIATYGRPARYIQVINAGAFNLSVITGAGNTRTVTVATGDEIGPVYVTDILLATTVTRLRVYF